MTYSSDADPDVWLELLVTTKGKEQLSKRASMNLDLGEVSVNMDLFMWETPAQLTKQINLWVSNVLISYSTFRTMSSYNIRAPYISPLTTNELTQSSADDVAYYLTFNKSLPSVTTSSLLIKTYPDFANMANPKPVISGQFVTETSIKINIF